MRRVSVFRKTTFCLPLTRVANWYFPQPPLLAGEVAERSEVGGVVNYEVYNSTTNLIVYHFYLVAHAATGTPFLM